MALVSKNLAQVSDNWWAHLVRGLVALAVGVFVLVSPNVATTTLAILIGCWLIADGVINVVNGLINKKQQRTPILPITIGVVSIVGGILLFFFKSFALTVSFIVIGIWAVVIGSYALIFTVKLRHQVKGETTLPISGALAVVLGLLMILVPIFDWQITVTVMGIFLVVLALILIMVALRLFQMRTQIKVWAAKAAGVRAQAAAEKANLAARDASLAEAEAVALASAVAEAKRARKADAESAAADAGAQALQAESELKQVLEAGPNNSDPQL